VALPSFQALLPTIVEKCTAWDKLRSGGIVLEILFLHAQAGMINFAKETTLNHRNTCIETSGKIITYDKAIAISARI